MRYEAREGWSPVSEGLAGRLAVLAEIRGATTTYVVGLSPASVRRRVREAADYGGSGPDGRYGGSGPAPFGLLLPGGRPWPT